MEFSLLPLCCLFFLNLLSFIYGLEEYSISSEYWSFKILIQFLKSKILSLEMALVFRRSTWLLFTLVVYALDKTLKPESPRPMVNGEHPLDDSGTNLKRPGSGSGSTLVDSADENGSQPVTDFKLAIPMHTNEHTQLLSSWPKVEYNSLLFSLLLIWMLIINK